MQQPARMVVKAKAKEEKMNDGWQQHAWRLRTAANGTWWGGLALACVLQAPVDRVTEPCDISMKPSRIKKAAKTPTAPETVVMQIAIEQRFCDGETWEKSFS